MSAKKPDNPFLKKSAGPKPPTRAALRKGVLPMARPAGHGLGRGLDSLISPVQPMPAPVPVPAAPAPAPVAVAPAAVAPAPAVPETEKVITVPPLDIERSPYQPRAEFKPETLQELADSIRANGIIQPISCRRRGDGKLELICGERRLRAAVLADVKLVPVLVKDVDDATAATMTVTENAQRDDLNPIDEAEGYRTLTEKFNFTQGEIAEKVGKSRTSVTHAMRLLELPEDVQDLLRKRAISTGHAKVLLSLENAAEIRRFAQECAPKADPRTGEPVGGLTVRELERRIARVHAPVVERHTGTPDMPESYTRQLAEEIHKQLGCAVRLTSGMTHANGKHTKGVLEIDFLNNDDLDRIIRMMGVSMD